MTFHWVRESFPNWNKWENRKPCSNIRFQKPLSTGFRSRLFFVFGGLFCVFFFFCCLLVCGFWFFVILLFFIGAGLGFLLVYGCLCGVWWFFFCFRVLAGLLLLYFLVFCETSICESVLHKALSLIIRAGLRFYYFNWKWNPGLNESHIQIAALRAANHQSRISPTIDGGDYLIAIHRESFERNLLFAISLEY